MKFNCDVKVVDMVMGAGKTSAAINYMNENKDCEKFIYVVAYEDDIERVMQCCPDLDFVRGKLQTFNSHFKAGRNIIGTANMLQFFTDEMNDYTLFMDEVVDVVEDLSVPSGELCLLFNRYMYVDDENEIFKWFEFGDDFGDIKKLCDANRLTACGNRIAKWNVPPKSFSTFRKVFLLTYIFNGQMQRYYFDYYGLPYTLSYVCGDSAENYHFTDVAVKPVKRDFSKLIHIAEDEKLNRIGDRTVDLSCGWFVCNADNKLVMRDLKLNINRWFKKIMKSPASNNMWYTFKDFRNQLSHEGYVKGFADDSYETASGKNVLAYCANPYLKTYVCQNFISKCVGVDQDAYTTFEILRFIWRSAIREGKEIWIYVPSSRVRDLLKKWIANNDIYNYLTSCPEM